MRQSDLDLEPLVGVLKAEGSGKIKVEHDATPHMPRKAVVGVLAAPAVGCAEEEMAPEDAFLPPSWEGEVESAGGDVHVDGGGPGGLGVLMEEEYESEEVRGEGGEEARSSAKAGSVRGSVDKHTDPVLRQFLEETNARCEATKATHFAGDKSNSRKRKGVITNADFPSTDEF